MASSVASLVPTSLYASILSAENTSDTALDKTVRAHGLLESIQHCSTFVEINALYTEGCTNFRNLNFSRGFLSHVFLQSVLSIERA
jgi:hypothetical protein